MYFVLQNRVFIYRGKEYERLADFTARLQNQFPNAHVIHSLSFIVIINVTGEVMLSPKCSYCFVCRQGYWPNCRWSNINCWQKEIWLCNEFVLYNSGDITLTFCSEVAAKIIVNDKEIGYGAWTVQIGHIIVRIFYVTNCNFPLKNA